MSGTMSSSNRGYRSGRHRVLTPARYVRDLHHAVPEEMTVANDFARLAVLILLLARSRCVEEVRMTSTLANNLHQTCRFPLSSLYLVDDVLHLVSLTPIGPLDHEWAFIFDQAETQR
jgi:hypothetical protein